MNDVVLCVDLNQDCFKTLKRFKEKINLNNVKVHLIHVVENPLHDDDLSPFTFPLKDQQLSFESRIIESLKSFGNELGIESEHLIIECSFALSRKDKIKKYLETVSADVVVIATRGSHGIGGSFHSSLASFLISFSPCNVLILRPEMKEH